jgi:serine/threonine-protein kinase CHEK1
MMFTQPLYHQTTIFSQQLDKSRFFANSQQLHTHKNNDNDFEDLALGVISMDPMQCQYSQLTNIPESMSQRARKFNDLIPAGSRSTRFYSKVAMESLVPLLNATLNRLSVQVPSVIDPMIAAVHQQLEVPIVAPDRRRLSISGKIKISKLSSSFIEVDFVRLKGDPLEWRYLFKKVVLQCREAVYIMNSN